MEITTKKAIVSMGFNPLMDRDWRGVVEGPFLVPRIDIIKEIIQMDDPHVIKEGDLPTDYHIL